MKQTRLNTWTPLDPPWDTPMSQDEQDSFAESAVISGATTEAQIQVMFNDNPRLFVSGQRLGTA